MSDDAVVQTEAEVFHRSDSGCPSIAMEPVCNGCGTTDFPNDNVHREEQDHSVLVVHYCSRCGTLSATEVPQWRELGESDVIVSGTSEGWLAIEENDVGGPAGKWEALEEIGYSRDDVKALFGEVSA